MLSFPIRLKKGKESEVLSGQPWIYKGDIIESSEQLHIPPGALVSIENHKGEKIATGYFNAKSQISCRVLTLGRELINTDFFLRRLQKALSLRQQLIGVPYYRLVHSEADFLPGLLIDRFGEHLVVQVGSAGMEAMQALWLAALEELLNPRTIILRNDSGARKLEGLPLETKIIKGEAPEFVELQENGCLYYADLLNGQKTGWFFDQRDNRRMIAELSKGKTVADIYSHSGGFGVLAAKYGAKVTLVDSSKLALELAAKAAARNEVAIENLQGDAFEVMKKLPPASFDIVLADPPAFVKTKKDIEAGMRGYEKVARLAAALVKPGGLLFVASCSHHATRPRFNDAVLAGVHKAGSKAKIIKQTGAAADHPKHPKLPQSEYLKGLLLRIENP